MQITFATHDVFEPPVTIGGDEDLKTVVVRDAHGNAIFAAVQQDSDNIWAITADNPRFNAIVQSMGISTRAQVSRPIRMPERVE